MNLGVLCLHSREVTVSTRVNLRQLEYVGVRDFPLIIDTRVLVFLLELLVTSGTCDMNHWRKLISISFLPVIFVSCLCVSLFYECFVVMSIIGGLPAGKRELSRDNRKNEISTNVLSGDSVPSNQVSYVFE